MKNLFICLTPLQALIAQALLRQSAAPADLLMLCYAEADNDKFRHYFRETAALADTAAYCVIPRSIWQRERQLPALARRLRTEYATVFAASIDNANVQYLLSRIRFARLETFDDGTANINPASSFYRPPPAPLHRRAARLLLNRLHRIRCTTDSLRRQSRRHHTLYPGLPNIAESVSPIALWQPSDAETRSGSLKTESILLGQPALPDPDANARLMSQIARHFNIPHYFPHPRETRTVGGIGYINTPLIFEDYLLRELQRQPETQFCLYHLASTAALNTAAFPHVQIRAIRPAHPLFLSPNWANLYRLMAQMGMEIVEFQAA